MSKNNCFIVKKQLFFEDHCSLISDDLYSSTTTCVECLKMVEKLKHSKILLGVFFTSTVTLLGVIIFYKINKFKKGMNSLIEDEVSLATVCSDKNENLRTPIKLTDSINDNTELTILAELKKFEDNLMFTRKGITLGNLATEFQTNVKYLSAIIKEHRADNFKSYINNLRINYIVNKVKNDPSFKRYKLSYLAELSGFPTASSFTKTFKDIIGTTPSLYFSQIKDDEN
ncbi:MULTISPECIES: helix-turn-helix domain-containing protein [Chryseobacterium]|uniref:helix-turn-helix domain-containing protein n=1 Tax=Chryseobacterium TaxID=59732 RepID=UPI00195EB480|nr:MULTISPECIES: helix-turn-helix domain-containing protein [Chryseobacterium]MBM7420273.1 YesN/AraC family two-component response regulator [Chryseobacterium sp. JUb44]WSO08934.1 helix-turn-helix domain-containing protein [Chryseobacterium scophthalmum]